MYIPEVKTVLKYISLSCVAVVFSITGTAYAADLAPQPTEPLAPTEIPYSWTGFYAGVNAGYGFAGNDRVGANALGVFLGNIGTLKPNGFLGGIQAGYNYEIGNNIVLGLEADFEGAQIKDTVNGFAAGVPGRARSDVQWFGTVRPRIGYSFDRFLVYATGGLAYGQINYKLSGPAFGGSSFSENDTRVGWVAGAGLEYAITDNITTKIEYQYVSFGHHEIRGATNASPNFHSVRVGINYKF